MPSVRHARAQVLRRRPVQRLAAAGAVLGLASGLATIEAVADDSPAGQEPEVRTVRVAAADGVELVTGGREPQLASVIQEPLEARQELLDAEAAAEQSEAQREAEQAQQSAEEAEQREAADAEAQAASEPAPASNGSVDVATWERLAECESGGNWSINTGNGFYGGLQFELSSWEWVGGTGMPHEASKQEQIARAEILLERQGWSAWPACSRQLGLR